MSITARREIASSKTASFRLSPRAKRANANTFMVNGISYAAVGYCAAKGYPLPGIGVLLFAPLLSMWWLASRHSVHSRHHFVGSLTAATVALIPTLAMSLAPAVKNSLLVTLLAQSMLIFVHLAAFSFVAHGCGAALAELWPVRSNLGSRRSRGAERGGAGSATSWQGLAAFCRAIEPIVPVLEKLVPCIKVAIASLTYVLIRWLWR